MDRREKPLRARWLMSTLTLALTAASARPAWPCSYGEYALPGEPAAGATVPTDVRPWLRGNFALGAGVNLLDAAGNAVTIDVQPYDGRYGMQMYEVRPLEPLQPRTAYRIVLDGNFVDSGQMIRELAMTTGDGPLAGAPPPIPRPRVQIVDRQMGNSGSCLSQYVVCVGTDDGVTLSGVVRSTFGADTSAATFLAVDSFQYSADTSPVSTSTCIEVRARDIAGRLSDPVTICAADVVTMVLDNPYQYLGTSYDCVHGRIRYAGTYLDESLAARADAGADDANRSDIVADSAPDAGSAAGPHAGGCVVARGGASRGEAGGGAALAWLVLALGLALARRRVRAQVRVAALLGSSLSLASFEGCAARDIAAPDAGAMDSAEIASRDGAQSQDTAAADGRNGGSDTATPDTGAALDVPDAVDAVDARLPAPCDAGVRCGEDCVDTASDLAHCGACGLRCDVPGGGLARCVAGTCVADCPADTALVAGACVAARLRPLAPLSPARVASARPLLRWQSPPGATSASVWLCRSRACDAISASVALETTGASAQPGEPLSPGPWFWRVAARGGDGATIDITPVWEFVVGTASAAGPAIVDVNGDGYADLVVSAPAANEYTGEVDVYPGGASGPAAAPATRIASEVSAFSVGLLDTSVVAAGDVDGDGFGDIAVLSVTGGTLQVLYGAPSGPAARGRSILLPPVPSTTETRRTLAGAGDVDCDGYADLLVSDTNFGPPATAFILRGGPGGPTATAWIVPRPGSTPTSVLVGVTPLGDVDGDGCTDLALGWGPRAGGTSTSRELRRGGPLALRPPQPLPFDGSPPGSYATVPAGVGDVNGDGYADAAMLVFGTDGVQVLVAYLGSPAGLAPARSRVVVPAVAGTHGSNVVSAGDVDRDGYGDVLVAMPEAEAVLLFRGGPAGIAAAPARAWATPNVGDFRFGVAIAGPGDLNGDGFDDVVVGALGAPGSMGFADVYLGDASAASTAPRILRGPRGSAGSFGAQIASGP